MRKMRSVRRVAALTFLGVLCTPLAGLPVAAERLDQERCVPWKASGGGHSSPTILSDGADPERWNPSSKACIPAPTGSCVIPSI